MHVFPKSYRISGFGELCVKPSRFLPELRSFLSGLDGELLHFLRRAIGPFRDWWHAEHLRAFSESWNLDHGAGCGHRARQGPPKHLSARVFRVELISTLWAPHPASGFLRVQ